MIKNTVRYHRWSGWPGAICLDCGMQDDNELALADGTYAFDESQDVGIDLNKPCPGTTPSHHQGTGCHMIADDNEPLSVIIARREAEYAAEDRRHKEAELVLSRELLKLSSKVDIVRNKKDKKESINERASKARREHTTNIREIQNRYHDLTKSHPEEIARRAESSRKTQER